MEQPGQVPKILWANVAKNVSINETHTQTEDRRKQERKQGGTKGEIKYSRVGGSGRFKLQKFLVEQLRPSYTDVLVCCWALLIC